MHPHVIVPLCVVVPHLFYSCLPWSLVGDKPLGLSLSLHSIHILLLCPFLKYPYVISSLMHPHVRKLMRVPSTIIPLAFTALLVGK